MTTWDDASACSRALWHVVEPLHAVTYFTPESRAAFEEAGLRGFWRGYFAGRAAPLGPVGAEPVIAAFYGFAPQMIARALPDVWTRATPEAALAARVAGAHAALVRLLSLQAAESPQPIEDAQSPQSPHPAELTEAAALLREAAEAIDILGRPLGAANAALPWPEDPVDVLWHATTILREHRGDGHVAALLVEGLDGCESLALRTAIDIERAVLQLARGWTDEEWDAATARLIERGWLDAQGRPTDTALAARKRIEAVTDRLASGPWHALGPERTARLARLLEPFARAASAALPFPNPIGTTRLAAG